MEELIPNIHKAIEGCLPVEVDQEDMVNGDQLLEVAIGNQFQVKP